MTIALGILTNDGVVMGADTEYTGAIKQQGAKVWGIFPDPSITTIRCGLAGAGDAMLLRSIRDRVCASADFDKAQTCSAAIEAIEDQLAAMFQKHVFPNPSFNAQNPALSLVVGVRDGTASALYEASGTVLAQCDRYACVGYGADLGSYLVETLIEEIWDTNSAIALMAYVLKQVKKFSPYCGGDSHILVISKGGDPSYVTAEGLAVMEREFEKSADSPVTAISLASAKHLLFREMTKSTDPKAPPTRPRSRRARKDRTPSQE